MMKRRFLAPLASAALMAVALFATAPALAQVKTLKIVAHADVKILDPTFTTAYISRNFGYMVYDTLYAQDGKGTPKPQMAEKHTVSKDGLHWTFTLRPGLKFSDGTPRDLRRRRRFAAALGRARQHRPRHGQRRRRMEGGGRPQFHADAEGAVRHGARRDWPSRPAFRR